MNIILRKEAKEKGLKHYFTEKLCKNDHISKRRTVNGACLKCEFNEDSNKKTERSKKFRENNRDKFNQYQRQWYQDNKDSALLTRAKYAEAHPEKIKEIRDKGNKKFKEENPDYFSAWWSKNKDKSSQYNKSKSGKAAKRKWNQNNKGHKNYLTRKRQKQIIKATPIWADQTKIKETYILAEKMNDQHNEYHVDHIVPLHHPLVCGLHAPNNLRIITKEENLKKGNLFLVE